MEGLTSLFRFSVRLMGRKRETSRLPKKKKNSGTDLKENPLRLESKEKKSKNRREAGKIQKDLKDAFSGIR